jgi:hypothetical protein
MKLHVDCSNTTPIESENSNFIEKYHYMGEG